MPIVTINYLAVLVAAIAAMVIGALWYSPLMFANQWLKLLGLNEKTMKQMDKYGNAGMFCMFVSTLLTSFVLAHFIDFSLATTALAGAITGFWIWLGFVATTFVSMPLFEGKPWGVYLINVGYYLVSFVVMGIILALWS